MENILKRNLMTVSIALGLALAMVSPFAVFAADEAAAMQSAQQNKINGQVLDENGEPLIGVTVRVKGKQGGTITDFDGNFSIDAKPGTELVFTYVGYRDITKKASAGMKVQMEIDAQGLDEVVVIGFGTVKKRDVTGAVAQVKSDIILQTPTTDVQSALQGRISGLDINEGEMRIRGNRSINGSNAPLVIIDGVQGGSLGDLNPQDIETIDVMKDASSTAIYGSQGANGVIIVTTKKAETGKVNVSYDGYVTCAFRPDRPDYRSPEDYYNTRKLAAINSGDWQGDDRVLFDSDASQDAYKAGVWTDWENLLQRKSTWSTKHTVTLSGGNEKTSARFSLGYSKDGSKWKKAGGTDKFILRANIDHKLYEWISAGVSFQLTHGRTSHSPYEKAVVTGLELGSPYGIWDPDARTYNIVTTLVERPLSDSEYVNPLWDDYITRKYEAENYYTNTVANAYLDIHPIDGLNFRTQFNAHLTNSSSGSYLDGSAAYILQDKGAADRNKSTMTKGSGTYYEWNNVLTYNFKFLPEDHHLGLTFLTTFRRSLHDELSATSLGQTLASNLWWNLASNDGAANAQTHSSKYTQSQNFSYAARVSYDWKSRYLFTASLRRDGDSRLGQGHKWDWFPSAALAWRLSDEPFMAKTKKWLDDLKIRATYGVTGNAGIGIYGTKSGITFANWSFGFQDEAANRYILGVQDNNGSGLWVLGNPDTKWEKSTTYDIGFDAIFLNSRINVTFDWYLTNTKDVILLRQLPTSSGQDGKYAIFTNIGSTKNTGVEVSINTRNIVTKNFEWNSTLTFSANSEKITDLVDGTNIQVGTNKEDGTLMIGHPIKSFNTFTYEGIWKTSEKEAASQLYKNADKTECFVPGDVKVADLDGDGIIDQNKDIGYVGSTSPNWFAGFSNDFRIKDFDVSIYMYARWGQWAESKVANYQPATGNMYTNYNYWAADTNESGTLPALRKGAKLFDYVGYQSLQYCENSFIKIKRISLGYTLPKSVLKNAGINKIRFYATVNDPFYFVKNDWQKNYDPEGAQRSVTLGLNVIF
ncbi:MAG: TonB-dependent receptor [Bacteroidaceae bacterium]|nr:TonB-dependent receptor [Bacteroidaceae bacterium]